MTPPPKHLEAYIVAQKLLYRQGKLSPLRLQMLEDMVDTMEVKEEDVAFCIALKRDFHEHRLTAEEVASCEEYPAWCWDEYTQEELELLRRRSMRREHAQVAAR